MRFRDWAVAAACGLIAACAQTRPTLPPIVPVPTPPVTAPAPPSPSATTPAPRLTLSDLPGWTQDDHVAALAAYAAGCSAARAPEAATICRRARALTALPDSQARAFFERNFRLDPIPLPGLLTAYFTPIYQAGDHRDGQFSAPVRPRPADLIAAAPPPDGAYADRAAIEAWPADDAVAWMRPEDLFFLQIQGSGVLVFADGRRARAVFDGVNGARFVGIAAPLRRRGLLGADQTSASAIRAWLAAHRGPDADAVMRLDPRYVFFRLAPDDGREPAGAAGIPLPRGRAVAVDPAEHAMGELLWIDAASPTLAGAFPTYRRLVTALDTGGAIKGAARADLYLGRGDAAGAEAGRVRHVLSLYRLVPISEPGE